MANGTIELPSFLKITMAFIDRVGFPILAFILMFYMSYTGLQKVSTSMENNTIALTKLCTLQQEGQARIIDNQRTIHDNLSTLLNRGR